MSNFVNNKIVGIDIGSVSISVAVLSLNSSSSANIAIEHTDYHFHSGHIRSGVRNILSTIPLDGLIGIAVTSGTPHVINNNQVVDPISAKIEAARFLHPRVKSILSVGGERFSMIRFDDHGNYSSFRANSSCAAGTGAFLDQQAERLGLKNSASLSSLAMANKTTGAEKNHGIPKIASRCSVFAKTDLIHAQQEGYSLAAICEGLCLGVAKNVAETVCKNNPPQAPIVMCGGVALNKGVVKQVEKCFEAGVIIDQYAPCYDALGSALILAKNIDKGDYYKNDNQNIETGITDIIIPQKTAEKTYAYPALVQQNPEYPDFTSYYREIRGTENQVEIDIYKPLNASGRGPDNTTKQHKLSNSTQAEEQQVECHKLEKQQKEGQKIEEHNVYFGIDIGSTSTKGILMTEDKQVLAGLYTRTAGNPVQALGSLLETIEYLEQKFAGKFIYKGVGTTGSGRKFIGAVINSDGVYDEITAHARAAYDLNPEIDTIIEIGGQDAKFTTLSQGNVTFCQMNSVCAAGTGSFIEEQAKKLDVPLSKIPDLCINTSSPMASDRCTVFMERDINHYLNRGYSTAEVLTAVLHSIRENYLNKVAVRGSIGKQVCFQGATAKNRALVAAFEQKLQQPIFVSPYCHLTGAYGTALLLKDEQVCQTKFRGTGLWQEHIEVSTEECTLCTNNCTIKIAAIGPETVSFGALCGRERAPSQFINKKALQSSSDPDPDARKRPDQFREGKPDLVTEAVPDLVAEGKKKAKNLLHQRKKIFKQYLNSLKAPYNTNWPFSNEDPSGSQLSNMWQTGLWQTSLLQSHLRDKFNITKNRFRYFSEVASCKVNEAVDNKNPADNMKSSGSAQQEKPVIGLPAALAMADEFYLWKFFFTALDIPVISSENCNSGLDLGKAKSGAEFCSPMLELHGHVWWLKEQQVDLIFLPHHLEQTPQKSDTEKNRRLFCYYTRYATSAIGCTDPNVTLLTPLVNFKDPKKTAEEIISSLSPYIPHLSSDLVKYTFITAWNRYRAASKKVGRLYTKHIQPKTIPESAAAQTDISVVLLGRPYTVLSPYMNKRIPELFSYLGVNTLYQDMLPALKDQKSNGRHNEHWSINDDGIGPLLQDIHWHYAARILEAAAFSADEPGLYPVFITSFKCSPDSFILDFFKRRLDESGKPYLILQLDEHDSSVGYETRIEAGIRAFRNHYKKDKTEIRISMCAAENPTAMTKPPAAGDITTRPPAAGDTAATAAAGAAQTTANPAAAAAADTSSATADQTNKKADQAEEKENQDKEWTWTWPWSWQNFYHRQLAKYVKKPADFIHPQQAPQIKNLKKVPVSPVFEESLNNKTLLFPVWDPITTPLLSAVLHNAEIDVRLLEEDESAIRRGLGTNSGQCIPVNIIAQECIDYVKKYNLDPGRTVLWLMRSRWSCNVPLYPHMIKNLFESQGYPEIGVYRGELTFFDIAPKAAMNAYFAYLFGGLIRRLSCKTRPYERVKGRTNQIVKESVDLFVNCFNEGLDKSETLEQVIQLFKSVPITTEQSRPKVAIFGDFYVRENDVMNQNLIESIEAAGGEVITTPYSDYVKIVAQSHFERLYREGYYRDYLKLKPMLAVLELLEKRYRPYIGEIVPKVDSAWSSKEEMEKILNKFYVRFEHEGEVIDNILKIVSTIQRYPDVDLFVQASPAFCCPSLITEAMAKQIETVTGVPVVPITYDGTGTLRNDAVIPYLKHAENRKKSKAIAHRRVTTDT